MSDTHKVMPAFILVVFVLVEPETDTATFQVCYWISLHKSHGYIVLLF